MEQLENLVLTSFFQSNITEKFLETGHFLWNRQNFFLEFIFLFVGQFTQVGFVLFKQMTSGFSFFTNCGDKKFVKAEHMETRQLCLEDCGTSQLICFFLHLFVQKFRNCFQDPKYLSVKLLSKVRLSNIFKLEFINS